MGRTENKTGEETFIQPELTHTVSRIINPDHLFSIPDHFLWQIQTNSGLIDGLSRTALIKSKIK